MKNRKIYLTISLFILFFLVAIFLIYHRVSEEKPLPFSPKKAAHFIAKETLHEKPQTRSSPATFPAQWIALELIQGVLKQKIPLLSLKVFLKTLEDPWAQRLLDEVEPLESILSYEELQEQLWGVPAPLSAPSLFTRLQNTVCELISIRKTTEEREEITGLKAIEKALYFQDLPKALKLFDTLSASHKAARLSWKDKAKERLILENLHTNVLLETAKKAGE